MDVPKRRRPGPESKGDRRQFTMRLPAHDFAIYKAAADKQGLSLADYLAGVLAHGHGLPTPTYLYRHRRNGQQPQLPLTGTG